MFEVARIPSGAPHAAFTGLLAGRERLYCTCREGDDHVHGADGRIRILMREGDGPWSSVGLLELPGIDLRDPKLSLAPDGRIMVSLGGSRYVDRVLQGRKSMVSFSDPAGETSHPPVPVLIGTAVRTRNE